MPEYKVGAHLLVKLAAARIVEATVKAVLETSGPPQSLKNGAFDGRREI
jgi:hypothetical protein